MGLFAPPKPVVRAKPFFSFWSDMVAPEIRETLIYYKLPWGPMPKVHLAQDTVVVDVYDFRVSVPVADTDTIKANYRRRCYFLDTVAEKVLEQVLAVPS